MKTWGMLRYLLAVCLGLTLLQPAWAGPGTSGPGSGTELSQVLNSDGTVRAGVRGSFSTAGYELSTNALGQPAFRPAGTSRTQAAGDERWSGKFAMRGIRGAVYALAMDGAGNLYAGGDFTYVDEIRVGYVAKWNGTSWSALGNGPGAAVRALVVDAAGVLYAGGESTRSGFAGPCVMHKWDGNTWSSAGWQPNNVVRTLCTDAAGNLYAGGDFDTGLSNRGHVKKFDGTTWSDLRRTPTSADGTSGTVYALAMQGTDLLVGGSFGTAGGYTIDGLARWNGTDWSAVGSGRVGIVYALACSGATLYAGGSMYLNNFATSANVARWDGATWTSLTTYTDGAVKALTIDAAGQLYAGGEFAAIGGAVANQMAVWNGTTWAAMGDGLNGRSPTNGGSGVRALASHPVTGIYAGGEFTGSGPHAANGIVRWTGTAWNTLGTGQGIYAGEVASVVLDGSGNLYAGGRFASIGSISASNIARWDGTSWTALAQTLDGQVHTLALDASNNLYMGGDFTVIDGLLVNHIAKWNGSGWSALGAGTNNDVYALAIRPNGQVCIGGMFTTAGGVTARAVARWTGSAWLGMSTSTTGTVYTLCTDPTTGDVYAGGSLSAIGGVTVSNVARWNGSTWSRLGGNFIGIVRALLMPVSGTLYAGGDFTQAGGVAANRIARWNGSVWSAMSSGVNGPVYDLALGPGGLLYVSGLFSAAAAVSTRSIAIWNGTTWAGVGLSAPIEGYALAYDPQGGIYLGGSEGTYAANTVIASGITYYSLTAQAPTLTAITPATGTVGSIVSLTGTNLRGTTTITFAGGGTVTSGFVVNLAGTQITGIVVPSGTSTGAVTATTSDGTSNGVTFTLTQPLAITSVSPVANTRNAARTSPVQVTFNQAITNGSASALKVFSSQRGGLRSTSSGTTTVSGSTASFTPTYNFKPGETVQATVTTAATATAGGNLATPRVLQFTAAATGGTGIFSGGSDPAIGLYSRNLAAGDVDGDGDLDMLACHGDNNAVSVRLNNGSGAFGGGSEVAVGISPRQVTVGDVDGDGDLDLLTANYGANTVSVRFNNGSGTFGGGSDVAVGPTAVNNVFSVVLADVDGDGDQDILAASNDGNTVSIRLNNGSGTFAGGSDPTVGVSPYMVAVGDVDGDGDLDFVTPNSNAGTVSVRLNNGSGTFGGGTNPAVGTDPYSVALGDIDGDGDLDLLTANYGSGNVSVRFNNGAGVFSGVTELATGTATQHVTLGDIDGDGDLDMLAANEFGPGVIVRLNNGSGVFGSGTNPAVSTSPNCVTLADVDSDGDLDLLTSHLGGSVSVRFNNLPAPVPALTSLSPTSGPVGTSVTITGTNLTGATSVSFNGTAASGFTVNGAGTQITGVVVPSGATTGAVTVTTPGGTSSGLTFTVTTPLAIISVSPTANTRNAARTSPVQVTFNQAITSGSTAALQVFSAQRGGLRSTSSGTTTVSGSTASFTPTYAFMPGEKVMTTVTKASTASAGGSLATARTFQFTAAAGGTGRGGFTAGLQTSIEKSPSSLALGDLDGDGDLDFAAVSMNNSAFTGLTVGFNGGDATGSTTGRYTRTVGYRAATSPLNVVLGDVDGDGDLDIVSGSTGSTVLILLNGGDASGSNTGIFSTGETAVNIGFTNVYVALGDVDGDGDLDIAATGSNGAGTYVVRILLNGGDATGSNAGTFQATTVTTVFLPGTGRPAFGDVDGDGDLDLLVPANGQVSIRLNGGDATGSNTGTFAGSSSVPVPGASDVRLGDLDGDNDLDMVVGAGGSGGTVSVRFNDGLGVFSGTQQLAVPPGLYQARWVELGDVDADGDLDLVFAVEGPSNTVSTLEIRLNGGDASGSNTGVFSNGSTLYPNASPAQLVLGDVDGDGDLDMVAATSDPANGNLTGLAQVFLNERLVPTLTALTPTSGPIGTSLTITGTNLTGATSVSFNGTTQTAITNNTSTSLTVVVPSGATTGAVTVTTPGGTSNGLTFTVTPPLAITSVSPTANTRNAARTSPVQVTFNQAITSGSTAALQVFSAQRGGLRSTSSGTTTASGAVLRFVPGPAFVPGETVDVSITPAATAAAGGSLAPGRVLRFTAAAGVGPGVFGGGSEVSLGGRPTNLTVADIDNDGDLDLLTPDNNNSSVSVRLNNGAGGFSGTTSLPMASQPYALTTADVDGDGDPDLLVGNVASGSVSVRFNDGAGNFTGTTNVPMPGGPRSLAVGDLDADGDLDLLATNMSANTVSVRFNDGTGNFTGTTQVPVGTLPVTVLTADIDGDGDLDILTNNNDLGTVSVRLNNGAGVFSGTTDLPLNSYSFGLVAADLDGDGDLDLLTGSGVSGNTVQVHLNNGAGTFASPTSVVTDFRTQGIVAADVDGDGDLDILTANTQNSSTISVRLNNGAASFSGTLNVPTGDNTLAVAAADVDGDGDLDILAANTFGNSVSVRLNQNSPAITALTPASGPVGTSVSIAGSSLSGATAITFAGGALVSSGFVVNAAGTAITGVVVPAGATTGLLTVTTPGGTSNGLVFTVVSAPTISGFTPASGLVGTSVTLMGTAFTGATSLTLNGVAVSGFTVVNATTIQFTVPAGSTSGLIAVTTPGGTATSATSFTVLRDLVVSTGTPAAPVSIAADTYRNVTITGTGAAVLAADASVAGTFDVQAGGFLTTNCQAVTGTGNFVLAAGATLAICDANGLRATGNSGPVRVAGTRSFSTEANYVYNGSGAQETGSGLPATVRSLTTLNNSAVTLTLPVSISQMLTIGAAGNLSLAGHALTLLSDATGTALVVNSGTGVVTGGTATVQRYLTPTNPGLGYRHYSSPVRGNTLADLQTGTFTPVFNPAYNTSAQPNFVTPFPTVFGYEQSRVAGPASTYSGFDKGWYSPATGSSAPDAFVVGKGYSVNLAGTEKVDFTGTLNTGAYPMSLARTSGPTAADGGWALVGNPYPAPIDWTRIAPADRAGLDASIYVFESSSQYGGAYRAYVNGVGSGSPLIGTAQGFWVRVSSGQTAGALTFRDSHRLTSYATQVPMRRSTADTRPQLQLTLAGNGLTDELYLYAEAGATAAVDAAYDAAKLLNPHGLNVATRTATGAALAIDGRADLSTAATIPLQVGVPAAGRYTFAAATLANLAPGTTLELVDALLNTRTGLTTGASYTFSTTATTLPGRFWLNLSPATALGTGAAALAAQVQLYPNPAHGTATLLLPAGLAAGPVVLLNSLGQVVRTLPAGGVRTTIDLHGLAAGVYTLRLTAGAHPVVKRLVVE